MRRTGFIRHPIYLEHVIDVYHPESPQRLEAIYAMVDGEMADRLVMVEPREASHEEIGWIHSKSYLNMVAETEGRCVRLDPDTATSPASYRAALRSAGGLLAAVDAVFAGEVDNAFAAIRPPGHHAEANRAAGFCIFNNVAVAAEYAIRKHGLERILIFDWDLHHGNGTQHSFESTGKVLYMSTHQYPYYPGTGAFHEVGRGAGEGYTVNMPMQTGYGTGDFLRLIDEVVKPITLSYQPQLILISAGFDTYEGDPLGGMNVSATGYGAMTDRMLRLADACCDGKLIMTLEGGYHINGLRQSVRRTLETMIAGEADPTWLEAEVLNPRGVNAIVGNVREMHLDYWPELAEND